MPVVSDMTWQRLAPPLAQPGDSNCAKNLRSLAAHAEIMGCSAIAIFPCLYDKPATAQDLVDYCAEVAKAAPTTPLLYYHIPFKTGVNLLMSEFLTLGADQVPTLSGIKFTDGDVSGDGRKCLTIANGCMRIFNGFDQPLAEALSVGFEAAINVNFNFFPQMASSIFHLAAEGKRDEAQKIQEKVNGLLEVIFKPTGGFSPSIVKAAMTMLTGIDVGPARKPIKQLTQEQLQALRDGLTNSGLKLH
ncbi:unnamed protein product [Meganyctiphanes norvegica]|uniref:N-acetylneuraminate lyase n=1 Tax=Meganyctiphanes norvegica TaxID=48144 RepID=A0AAV2Q7Z2_MEGNR